MPLNIPPLQWPKIYNMVNLGGIDLATANGSEVPGIYQKITEALTSDHIEVFYNWKFADIVLPPSKVVIDVSVANQYIINEEILVKSDDTVGIIGFIRIPIIVPLTAEENAVYNIPTGADGFGPVTVQVPIPTPTLVTLNVDENGTYTPATGVDGFDEVVVDVPITPPTPPPVLVSLNVDENGTYTPEAGVDGFSEVVVDVPAPPTPDPVYLAPIHKNSDNGYVSGSTYYYYPQQNCICDIFQVSANKVYKAFIGDPAGNRLRALFTTVDPHYVTSNINGTACSASLANPSPYDNGSTFTAPSDGFITIFKDNTSRLDVKSFVVILSAINSEI